MTDPISTFLKRLEAVRLSSNERLQMRERLALYADMHGAMATAAPAFGFFAFLGSRRFSTYAGALVILLVLGASVTLGAEGSVPGDALYSVKTDVTEPLMSALATSPAGQAKVASAIATRRIDEAVTLASRGELTPQKQDYLSNRFNESVAVAAKKTDELAQIDSVAAEDVKASFAANLAGEAQALGAITAKSPDGGKALLSVIVATSENVSDAAAGDSLVASAPAPAEEASSTMPEEPARPAIAAGIMRAATLAAPAGTSTASSTAATSSVPVLRASATGRFARSLRLLGSTTLEARLASSTLRISPFLLPKSDLAIPAASDSSQEETGSADGGLDLEVGK